MADLWQPEHTETSDDILRERMIRAHQADLDDMAAQGFIPTWIECDVILQVDESRLLNHIADNGGITLSRVQQGTASTPLFPDLPRITQSTTAALGMIANANAKAVIQRCKDNGWIVQTYSEADDAYRLDVTPAGMLRMDMAEQEREWGGD